MAYSDIIANRIREKLKEIPNVEEKKMFGKLAFLISGKLCLSAGKNQIMCRFDPELHNKLIKEKVCETVIMKGRNYKGYIYVNENNIKSDDEIEFWINLALDWNEKCYPNKKQSR
jgi:TfoX/Sxy family transcriptional regulator of competence genes